MEIVALFAIFGLTQLLSLGLVLVVLWHVKKFLVQGMVFMKSRDIHEVMAADSLLQDKPKTELLADENEVVAGVDMNADHNMKAIQRKNRLYLGLAE